MRHGIDQSGSLIDRVQDIGHQHLVALAQLAEAPLEKGLLGRGYYFVPFDRNQLNLIVEIGFVLVFIMFPELVGEFQIVSIDVSVISDTMQQKDMMF
jgi:hypothetical protein